MALRSYLATEIALDHVDGLLTRREALQRLGLLGLTAVAASGLLSACADATPAPAAPSPAPAAPSPPRPSPPRVRTPSSSTGGGGQAGELPVGGALTGDEVEVVARKYQDMTNRCHKRSQRGVDSILVGEVKKIAVTLTIDRDGSVSELQLSDHASDNLGKCLTTMIKTWKFRSSPGGTFRFSLNFVDG